MPRTLNTDCNVGLGRFKDDLFRLESAIRYLNLPPLPAAAPAKDPSAEI